MTELASDDPLNEVVRRTCPDCGASHRRTVSEKCRKCDPPPPRIRPGGARGMRERRRVEREALGRVHAWRSLDIRDPEQLRLAMNDTLSKAMTIQDVLWEMLFEIPRKDWRFTDDKGAEQMRTELKMTTEQLERTAKILNDTVGKRLEAARVAIEAKHAELIANVILHVIENPDLALSAAIKAQIRQLASEQLLSLAAVTDAPQTADGDPG